MNSVIAAESVHQAIAPCVVVSKLCGQIPLFSGVDLPLWKRYLNTVHFLVTISLIIRGIWYCLPMELSNDAGSSVVQKSGAFITVVYYLQPICASITSRFVSKTTHEIFKSLETVDNKLETLGYRNSYLKERKVVLVSTVCALTGSSGVLLMYVAQPLEADVEFTLVNIFFVVHYSMAGTYACCTAYLVLKRFHVVKDIISTQFPLDMSTDEDVFTVNKQAISSEDQKMVLKQVKFVLDNLSSMTELMNRSFSIQLNK